MFTTAPKSNDSSGEVENGLSAFNVAVKPVSCCFLSKWGKYSHKVVFWLPFIGFITEVLIFFPWYIHSEWPKYLQPSSVHKVHQPVRESECITARTYWWLLSSILWCTVNKFLFVISSPSHPHYWMCSLCFHRIDNYWTGLLNFALTFTPYWKSND